jgi:uncharacterized Tic20 family protein
LIDQPTQVSWIDTTPDERTMATLAHALQLIGSWIAPLIIFLIRRRSRFVSFHALQALLLQIIHTIVGGCIDGPLVYHDLCNSFSPNQR